MFLGGGGDLQEHEGQEGEDERLDEANEDFEHEEWDRRHQRHQGRDDEQQDFTGKHISEQPEGERDDLREFGNEFDQSDEGHGRVRIEIFPQVLFYTDIQDAHDLCQYHGDHRDRDGHIQVSRAGAKEWHQDFVALMFFVKTDAPEARKQPHPVHGQDEKEDRPDEWEEAFRLFTIMSDRINEVREIFDDCFNGGLESAGHDRKFFRH